MIPVFDQFVPENAVKLNLLVVQPLSKIVSPIWRKNHQKFSPIKVAIRHRRVAKL